MLFKANRFFEIGMFDPRTFLYGEELFLAENVKKNGGCSFYEDSVVILHKHSETIKKHISIGKQLKERFKSEVLFYTSEYKISYWQIILAKISLKILTKIYIPLKVLINRI